MSVVQGVELCAKEIETLQGSHAGGAYCDDMTEVGNDLLDCLAWHGDNLSMHGMLVGISHLHGLESTRTDVQGDFGSLYTLLAQAVKDIIREVKTRSGGSHRTFDARIDGLIGRFIALLSLAIEVWRNR